MKKLTILILLLSISIIMAAQQQIQTVHKVKKQETVFGIAKQYGITIDELNRANPDMQQPDFVLKKGMKLNIPVHEEAQQVKPVAVDPLTQRVLIGVMLPLHDLNGDGRRMTEYYRGMLLAIRDLKNEGYNISLNTWNVAEDDDIRVTLLDEKASQCDVIFGPLYSKQVKPLADFCQQKGIRMVIPFSISGDDVKTYPQIYQVYQTQADIYQHSIQEFLHLFGNAHAVFIDCNDTSSKKGEFTFPLRKALEDRGLAYSITNLNNSIETFQKAFDLTRQNVVVLNTGRSPELGTALQRLDQLRELLPNVRISMFGYNEWFLYLKPYQEKLRKNDTYIPSVYDYNAQTAASQRLEDAYLKYFHTPMQAAIPRFAMTGYDQTMFFVRGMHQYGKSYAGQKPATFVPVQTPFLFERQGNGGYQNHNFMLVHFK